ncbi:hypothetical protein Ctob_005872 [Chrysochromulina tobinii]|uniref:Uncharacterized protein n=1 Tax=Chrysochromulina tobinii TaxID=1460289 RepID=A0A0M0K5Y1_9EUKA|nr:hypothetical protein Ctob_005872 [Chrysochromulina tobinii]|eukprot:KOO33798.1 hypothetical protein Ctob_005872 [Chrysochromulina sp. CCMP291]
MLMDLSDYELERLKKIAENKRMLVALGLETEAEQMRFAPKSTKQASASAASMKQNAAKKQKAEPERLTEAQRAALSRAHQWMERFEVWLRGQVSQLNADTTMKRVEELASGRGVYLHGYGLAFEGRAVSIADDLVALKDEAASKFGVSRGNGADKGGWHLNHPIGKLILFQQYLFSSSVGVSDGGLASLESPDAPSARPAWLHQGARVEVLMHDDGLHGSRYTATVVSVDTVEGDEGEEGGTVTGSKAGLGSEAAMAEAPHCESLSPSKRSRRVSGGAASASAPSTDTATVRAPDTTLAEAEPVLDTTLAEAEPVPDTTLEPVIPSSRPSADAPASQESPAAAKASEAISAAAREISVAARERASSLTKLSVRYDELLDDAGQPLVEEGLAATWVRPVPPKVTGFANRLRRGVACELWHNDGWWDVTVLDRHAKSKTMPIVTYEVYSEIYSEIAVRVGAAKLRPKLVLVDNTNWLALAPFGFKCKKAAKVAAATAREAEKAKESKAAKRTRGDDDAAALPREGSLRRDIFSALCAGVEDRDDLFTRVARVREWKRSDVVTVLGKEKNFAVPLWTQEGAKYSLTAEGRDVARAAGGAITGETTTAKKQKAAEPQPPARPRPPAGWVWPREGDWIEVEVAVKEESPPSWIASQVVVMLVDGMFQARIVLPDGSDEWLDWFTWEEEGSDWRRAEHVGGGGLGLAPS